VDPIQSASKRRTNTEWTSLSKMGSFNFELLGVTVVSALQRREYYYGAHTGLLSLLFPFFSPHILLCQQFSAIVSRRSCIWRWFLVMFMGQALLAEHESSMFRDGYHGSGPCLGSFALALVLRYWIGQQDRLFLLVFCLLSCIAVGFIWPPCHPMIPVHRVLLLLIVTRAA
jgi:hypothetical protein